MAENTNTTYIAGTGVYDSVSEEYAVVDEVLESGNYVLRYDDDSKGERSPQNVTRSRYDAISDDDPTPASDERASDTFAVGDTVHAVDLDFGAITLGEIEVIDDDYYEIVSHGIYKDTLHRAHKRYVFHTFNEAADYRYRADHNLLTASERLGDAQQPNAAPVVAQSVTDDGGALSRYIAQHGDRIPSGLGEPERYEDETIDTLNADLQAARAEIERLKSELAQMYKTLSYVEGLLEAEKRK